jgi:uncharacterized protein (DUF1501 family)
MPQPIEFQNAAAAMSAAAVASGSNRKTLVVVFLAGGSCAHNTIFPRTGSNRTHYTALRPSLSLADNPPTALDADWCLHPQLTGLKTLWDAGRLAVVRNVGPLVQPITKAEYLAGTVPTPFQLYSHSDQQNLWETGIADEPVADTGWLGRIAELMLPFNSGSTLPPLFSFAGPTDTFRAFDLRTLTLGSGGLPNRNGGWAVDSQIISILDNRFATHVGSDQLVQEWCDINRRAVLATATVNNAINSVADPTAIPMPDFGMRTAIRLSAAQASINQRRSLVFLQQGGYDHHANQLNEETGRFSALNGVLLEAYNATVANGTSSDTTFVVYSEFGRSLRQNGSGTDHGWGGHAFVFGGAVQGGWYGSPYSLDPDGPNMAFNQAHMIPTTSTDTLISSLAGWLGVPDASSNGVNPRELVVPNLANFPTRSIPLFT